MRIKTYLKQHASSHVRLVYACEKHMGFRMCCCKTYIIMIFFPGHSLINVNIITYDGDTRSVLIIIIIIIIMNDNDCRSLYSKAI